MLLVFKRITGFRLLLWCIKRKLKAFKMCTHFRSSVLRDKSQLLVYFYICTFVEYDFKKSIENIQPLIRRKLRSVDPK